MSRPSRTGTRGLYKDKNGRWSLDLRWHDPITNEFRRHRERFPEGISSSAAKIRARELLAAALSGKFDPDAATKPRTLSKAFDEYMTSCGESRKKKRRASCDRLLAIIKDKPLRAVTTFDVELFKSARSRGEGLAETTPQYKRKSVIAPATVNRDLEVLFHFFGRAAAAGWVTKEHAEALREVERLPEPEGRVRHWSAEEEAKVCAELPVRVLRITLVALLTGMRQAEVVRLKKSEVDLAHKQIVLPPTGTKNKNSRPVYLNDDAVAVIKEAMADSNCDYVFTSGLGGPYTCDGLRSIFRRAVERAGIEDLHFHDSRHTTATRLRRAGADLDLIAKVLGHRSGLRMVMRYAHFAQEEIRDAMAKLPKPPALMSTTSASDHATARPADSPSLPPPTG